VEQVKIGGKWYDLEWMSPKSVVVLLDGRIWRVRKHLVQSYRRMPV
jgi:hypothetical protein